MPLEFEIAPGRWIGGDHPCFIIAEIGQNHQGDLETAKKMIKIAKECGADCAKFQKSDLERKFNKAALERPYHTLHSWGKTYGDHKAHLEFSPDQFRELKAFADEIGILFAASGMDENSVDFLETLDVPFFKVGSGDTNNFPYLLHTAKKGRPMLISSGMQSMETMRHVYEIVKPINDKFCFMQCTSAYPLLAEDVHLRVIPEFQKEFPDIPIGYSGHETGLSISIAAVAIGAKVLERHITLDKSMKGSDHLASLEPYELRELVLQIRVVEKALGTSSKEMRQCELPTYNKLGKSIVAATKILKNTILKENMLMIKVAEPKGWPAELFYDIIGKQLNRDIEEDESITDTDIVNDSDEVVSS